MKRLGLLYPRKIRGGCNKVYKGLYVGKGRILGITVIFLFRFYSFYYVIIIKFNIEWFYIQCSRFQVSLRVWKEDVRQ